MTSEDLIREDHMRDNEFTRIPPEFLPNEIGAVSDEKELPPTDDLFSSREPYHLDPALFAKADALLAATPIGGEIHFDAIVEEDEQ